MENYALFFDGASAKPTPVKVSITAGQVQLLDEEDQPLQTFSLTGATHNQTGNVHFLYFDAAGLRYLQFFPGHALSHTLSSAVAAANRGWMQRLMRQRLVLLVPLMIALAVGLYFLVLAAVPAVGMHIISREAEMSLGNKLKDVLLRQTGMMGQTINEEGSKRLQAFGNRLQLSRQYPIRLTLVQSDVVNAFALPGGQIVVYTGLLQKIKTPEALAALLAHEATHVNERHSLRSLLRSAANGLVVAVLFGDATGISGALVSNADNLNGLRYSRSLEREADAEGIKLLLANRLNANGMVQLMETLNEEGGLPESLSFLSSHPLTAERIKAAKGFAASHPQKRMANEQLTALFRALKETS